MSDRGVRVHCEQSTAYHVSVIPSSLTSLAWLYNKPTIDQTQ